MAQKRKKADTTFNHPLKIAHDIRKLEINLLWKRAWFFWGFTLAGFAGFSYFLHGQNQDHQKALLVANFGFICSFIWTLANRGSKFWQDHWDKKIKGIEKERGGYQFFQEVESKYKNLCEAIKWEGTRFSPSKLIIALSDYITLSWLFILIMQVVVTIRDQDISPIGYFAFAMTIFTFYYAYIVYQKTQKHGF